MFILVGVVVRMVSGITGGSVGVVTGIVSQSAPCTNWSFTMTLVTERVNYSFIWRLLTSSVESYYPSILESGCRRCSMSKPTFSALPITVFGIININLYLTANNSHMCCILRYGFLLFTYRLTFISLTINKTAAWRNSCYLGILH